MNDYLEQDDMAAASGGLIFINGMGAIGGPFLVGWMMTEFGADSFFLYLAVLLGLSAVWALFRSTVRDAPSVEDTGAYAPISPSSSIVVAEVATEVAIDMADEAGRVVSQGLGRGVGLGLAQEQGSVAINHQRRRPGGTGGSEKRRRHRRHDENV